MSETPEEVIRQIQIRSRAAARLPEFNPEHPIQDPTQQQLSCCSLCSNGEQQQQLKKIMPRCCFICGRLNDDVSVPDPISFNSTLAFNCLITSLTLHGSEIIVDKTRGEIALSDFLNFRVEAGEFVEQNSKFLRLNTGSFFSKSKEDEHTLLGERIVEAPGHDSPDLAKTLTEESPQGFSEWEADFQFADDGVRIHVSSSSDHFTGVSAQDSELFDRSNDVSVHLDSVQDSESFGRFNDISVNMDPAQDLESLDLSDDLSVHMDSLFGDAKNVVAQQPKDDLAMLNDWNLDDLGTTVTPGLDTMVTSEDHHSTSADLFDDFLWKTNNTRAVESLVAVEEQKTVNEDSFDDEWNGFAGSEEPSGKVESEIEITNASSTENTTHVREINDGSVDEWNAFTGSDSSQNPSIFFHNVLQTNASPVTVAVNAIISEEDRVVNDYTDDVWNDFPGSSNLQDPSTEFWNEFQTNEAHITENTTTKEHVTIKDDLFDDWNGFAGSSSLQKLSGDIHIESRPKDTSVTENTEKLVINEAINEAWDDYTDSNNLQVPSLNVEKELNTKKLEENGATDDEWDGFTGSNSIHDPPTNIWNEWQTNDTRGTENTTVMEDSFDEFNDFTGSSTLQIPIENAESELQEKDTVVTENTAMPQDSKAENGVPIGELNGFPFSSILQDHSGKFQNELRTNGSHVTADMVMSNENQMIEKDSSDEWNDFTGSSVQFSPESVHTELQKNDSNVTDNTTIPVENKTKHDDPFDQWNFHTAANSLQGPSVDSWNQWQTNDPLVTGHMTEGKENKTISEKNDSNVTDNATILEENKAKNNPIDQWNFLTASSSLQDPSVYSWNQWQSNDPRVTEHVTEGKEHKMISEKLDSNFTDNTTMPEENNAKQDDPFDQWNFHRVSSSLQGPSVDSWNQGETNDPRVTEHMTEGKEHKTISDDEWNNFTGTGGLHEPSRNVEIDENLMKPDENKTVKKEIIDEWNGVTSSNNLQDPSTDIWNEWQTNGNLVSGSTTTSKEMKISDPFDEWNVFTGSSSLPDPSANVWNKSNNIPISSRVTVENDMFSSNSNIAESFWSQLQVDNTPVQETVTAVMEDKTENDDSLDEWNDFTGAGSFQDSSTNVGNGLQRNDTLVTDVTDTGIAGKEKMVNGDPYDEWNDFTGSSNFQNSSGSVGNGNNQTSVSDLKSAEIDVFNFSLENLHFTSLSNISSRTK